MKRTGLLCLAALLAAALACNIPQGATSRTTATPMPTSGPPPASPTQVQLAPPSTAIPPTAAPTVIFVTPPSPTLPAPPAATATPPAETNVTHAVVLVAENDVLNVRQAPGADSAIIDRLPFDATGVVLTGKQSPVGDQRWAEIQRPAGGTGWVNAQYLTEYIPPATFCSDDRPAALLVELGNALRQRDGIQLARLVSPIHGLDITYLRTGNTANYTSDEARWVFESDYQTNWGVHPASGKPIQDTFQNTVLPDLLDVLDSSYTTTCNNPTLDAGNYTYQWPARYRNFNVSSLHKPGPPSNELSWRTWLAGIEYVNGQPYLFALVHLFWEP